VCHGVQLEAYLTACSEVYLRVIGGVFGSIHAGCTGEHTQRSTWKGLESLHGSVQSSRPGGSHQVKFGAYLRAHWGVYLRAYLRVYLRAYTEVVLGNVLEAYLGAS
jgi:hypothetical protein